MVVPSSAANSLQFNQLIGGAISPSVLSATAGGGGASTGLPMAAAAGGATVQTTQTVPINMGNTNTMMIGDYVLNQQQQQLQQQNAAAQAAAAAANFRQ